MPLAIPYRKGRKTKKAIQERLEPNTLPSLDRLLPHQLPSYRPPAPDRHTAPCQPHTHAHPPTTHGRRLGPSTPRCPAPPCPALTEQGLSICRLPARCVIHCPRSRTLPGSEAPVGPRYRRAGAGTLPVRYSIALQPDRTLHRLLRAGQIPTRAFKLAS